ncbi:hypothetical protein [Paenibacillus elgii]|uniref:hypothetical protein n=1 Tax=Paenibacillus elgii TaxID=189691 RepID=UPI0013D60771|nr:hypothetical protein [Paenibacillus elgii]
MARVDEPRLMALVRDPENPGHLINIFIDECLYYDTVNRKIVYYHQNGKAYISATLLEDHDECPNIYGMGFRRLDNKNFVNIKKVTKVDKTLGEVYFDNVVTSQSRKASIAKIHTRPFLKWFRIFNSSAEE